VLPAIFPAWRVAVTALEPFLAVSTKFVRAKPMLFWTEMLIVAVPDVGQRDGVRVRLDHDVVTPRPEVIAEVGTSLQRQQGNRQKHPEQELRAHTHADDSIKGGWLSGRLAQTTCRQTVDVSYT